MSSPKDLARKKATANTGGADFVVTGGRVCHKGADFAVSGGAELVEAELVKGPSRPDTVVTSGVTHCHYPILLMITLCFTYDGHRVSSDFMTNQILCC
jgi:hypothetical protein